MSESAPDLALLYRTSARMGAAIDADAVVETYLNLVAAEGRYTCSITVYEDAQGQPYPEVPARVHVLGQWNPQTGLSAGGPSYDYSHDALDAALDRGETIAFDDVHRDPRATPTLRRLQAESGRPKLALIPLMARGERRFGLVVLAGPEPEPWTNAELRPYQITAVLLAASLDARLQAQLLRDRTVQVALVEERQRLARDLHDSVTQLLFAVQMVAQTLVSVWRRDPDEGERRTGRLQSLASDALGEMRALLAELRPVSEPSVAPEEPVGVALERLVQRFRDPTGPEIRLDARPVSLVGERRSAVLRIAGEAVANAVRHARARSVDVVLLGAVGWALEVRDDGCGFDLETTRERSTGMGLSSLHERARACGGRIAIDARPGAGTSVRLWLPEEARA